MAYEVSRIYKNASEEVIRIDTIIMVSTSVSLTTGINQRTYSRNLKTEIVLDSGVSDRTVAAIQLITNADDYESNPSTTNNYNWVTWSSGGSIVARCNMSDLPQITDSV